MILVCPSCDAKFKIPDGAIPPGGRKVRCAKCKHSWHAEPQQVLKQQPVQQRPVAASIPRQAPVAQAVMSDEMDAGAAARAAAIRRTVRDEVEEDPVASPPHTDDDLFDNDGGAADIAPPAPSRDNADGEEEDNFGIAAVAREAFGDDFDLNGEKDDTGSEDDYDGEDYDDGDFVARRRAEQRRQSERATVARERKLMLVGWGALILFWIVAFVGIVFMRPTVEQAFPGMADFYAMFEGVRDVDRFRPEEGEPLSTPMTEREAYVTAKISGTSFETSGGRQVLKVVGFVKNTGTVAGAMTAAVPQVLVELLDENDQVLASTIVDPPGFAIRRGSQLNFETSFYPVPTNATNVSVKVLEGTRSRTVPAANE